MTENRFPTRGEHFLSVAIMWSLTILCGYFVAYFAVFDGKVYHSSGFDSATGTNRYTAGQFALLEA